MVYFIIKCALSGIIIAVVSEVAKRSPALGALIVSLPLVSGRKTSSNIARSSLLCTTEPDVNFWPNNRSKPLVFSLNTASLNSARRKFDRRADHDENP